jgi:hypothetical protein
MAGYAPTTPRQDRPGGWVAGFSVFAAVMMIIIGVFQVVAGLTAIFRGAFYRVTPNYVFEFSVAGWGCIHLILGVLIMAAGFSVMSGRLWARVVGIALAALSAITNFLFIPHYPVWSILIIALDIVVICALASYDERAAA